MVLKIFISSVRNEFQEERIFLKQKLMDDPNLSNYIEVFLFESDVESSSKTPPEIYINEVRNSDIYIGIIGSVYCNLTDEGISATELEYTETVKSNLIIISMLKMLKIGKSVLKNLFIGLNRKQLIQHLTIKKNYSLKLKEVCYLI